MKTRKAITMLFVAALLLGAAGGARADICNGDRGCGGGTGSGGGGLPASSGPRFFISDAIAAQKMAQTEGQTEGVFEGETCQFTVKLKDGKKPASAHWKTKDGSAISGEDYEEDSGDIFIDPKEGNTKAFIFIQTNQDAPEPGGGDETFFVVLSNPHNATIADGKGKCVIHQIAQG